MCINEGSHEDFEEELARIFRKELKEQAKFIVTSQGSTDFWSGEKKDLVRFEVRYSEATDSSGVSLEMSEPMYICRGDLTSLENASSCSHKDDGLTASVRL